jgi:hypothetical protein
MIMVGDPPYRPAKILNAKGQSKYPISQKHSHRCLLKSKARAAKHRRSNNLPANSVQFSDLICNDAPFGAAAARSSCADIPIMGTLRAVLGQPAASNTEERDPANLFIDGQLPITTFEWTLLVEALPLGATNIGTPWRHELAYKAGRLVARDADAKQRQPHGPGRMTKRGRADIATPARGYARLGHTVATVAHG